MSLRLVRMRRCRNRVVVKGWNGEEVCFIRVLRLVLQCSLAA